MIIKNAILCDSNGERKTDIHIEDGMIIKIGNNLKGTDEIDAKGLHLLPGLIDLNVSLSDAQLNVSKLNEVSSSAIKGGVTTVVLNPNLEPSIDNEISLEFVLERKSKGAKIMSAVNATTNDNKSLSNIAILLKQGAVAPYLNTSVDSNLIRRVFEYMKMYEGSVFCSVQDTELNGNGVMFEGTVSAKLGLPGISVIGEIIHVAKMIEVSRYFGVKVLFKGLFARRSIEMINAAKKEGLSILCEISLHHLVLDDTSCDGFNAYAKVYPPLADKKGKEALIDALKNDEIDVLTSLHAPHSKVNKEVAFFDAAYGTEAIEEILPLYFTKLVKTGYIDLSKLSKMTSLTPAIMIHKNAGLIQEGMLADLVLFDTAASSVLNKPQSLYHNEVMYGKVISVFVEGRLINL